jgi:Domain of unknown function (DUF4105)
MITRYRYILLLLIIVSSRVQATELRLSDSTQISLLTCSRGGELYSSFGHSAVRVQDFKQHIDFVFNYGVFDFTRPGFYYNFCKGHMIYMLAVDDYAAFYQQYQYDHRGIVQQQLLLAPVDKQRLLDFLIDNANESKRDYRYDFLFDNCSTRIRDLLDKVYPGRTHIDYSSFTAKKSFRDLINDYSMDKPWWQWGMGLLIGLPVDHITSPKEQTFLPDYLSRAYAHTTLDGRALCAPIETILAPTPIDVKATVFDTLTPNVFFGGLLLLIVVLTGYEIRNHKHYYILDYLLLLIAGVLGTLMFVLWAFTEHTTTSANFNLLWALPTHLVAIGLLLFARRSRVTRYYFLLAAILAGVMAIGFWILPKHVLMGNVCIAAMMAARCGGIYNNIKTQIK